MEELRGEVPFVDGVEERTEIELLIRDTKVLNGCERATLFLSYFGDHSLGEIGGLMAVTSRTSTRGTMRS